MKIFRIAPLLVMLACSSTSGTPPAGDGGTTATKTDAEYQKDVTVGIKRYLQLELDTFYSAVLDLQAAAPTTPGRGWDKTQDAAALTSMKNAWRKGRLAYEHVEGAIAAVFPELDIAVDERYDGFLADVKSDDDLFDDKGV